MTYQKKNNRPPREGEGRPSRYDPKYCQEIIDYFNVPHSEQKLVSKTTGKNDYSKEEYKEVACELPFLSGFARKIDVSTQTLLDWSKVHPEFLVAYMRAKDLQHEMLHQNTLKGLYNAQYGQFAAKNITDWRDKVEVDHGLTDDAYEKYRTLTVSDIQKQLDELMPNRVQKLLT